jgi:amino acid adenylation domain-containing protein
MTYLVNQLLEASARRAPDAPAVLDGERTVTYGELDTRANQLANALLELGVRQGDRVALYLDKSIESLIAVYGALKAGAAYVPLDPAAPPVRVGGIAADAGARVLVTGVEKQDAWETVCEGTPELEWLVVLNEAEAHAPTSPGSDQPLSIPQGLRSLGAADLAGFDVTAPVRPTVDSDLAYILYTSGSTGVPKGVMLTHRNCLGFVRWAAEEFAVSPQDRLSSHAPLHFDLSTFDLFAAALAGAAVVLVPAQVSTFPSQVRSFIETAGITVWYSVPSILTMLVLRGGLEPGALPSLRTILFAGEVFPTRHLRHLTELLPHVRFANLYGPTETNVCTWWEVKALAADNDEAIPIGRAIDNVDVFAVTDEGRRAAPGEVGELYVRGCTVMQGYLGDPEKTASRLGPNPFGGVLEQPVYRTGDLVQESPDGSYRFLGRRDEQIKSRGYRIELGDIEATLHAHPAVIECAVVAIPDELITNRLEAYVSTRTEVSSGELASFCSERIPSYMIPAAFTFRDALPRASTGKVDRRALAEQAVAPSAS